MSHPTIQSYVNEVLTLAQQISAFSNALEDEFLGVILLNGITPHCDAMVLALENSNAKITSDLIKSKLLDQAEKSSEFGGDQQALFTSKDRNPSKCFSCNRHGHLSKNCPLKNKKFVNEGSSNSKLNTDSKSKHSNCKRKKIKHSSLLMALASTKFLPDDRFIDSGASEKNMCGNKNLFKGLNLSVDSENIVIANNEVVKSEGVGDCQVSLEGESEETNVDDVLYVPNLSVNLL